MNYGEFTAALARLSLPLNTPLPEALKALHMAGGPEVRVAPKAKPRKGKK